MGRAGGQGLGNRPRWQLKQTEQRTRNQAESGIRHLQVGVSVVGFCGGGSALGPLVVGETRLLVCVPATGAPPPQFQHNNQVECTAIPVGSADFLTGVACTVAGSKQHVHGSLLAGLEQLVSGEQASKSHADKP